MNKGLIKVIEDCGLEVADVKTILDTHLHLISQGLIITDIDGNTVDFNIEEGVIELPFTDPTQKETPTINSKESFVSHCVAKIISEANSLSIKPLTKDQRDSITTTCTAAVTFMADEITRLSNENDKYGETGYINGDLNQVIKDCGLEVADVRPILVVHSCLLLNSAARLNNEIKKEAVMGFANAIRDAYCSGFVSNDFTVYDVYRAARNHVKDKYCLFTPAWDDEYAKQSRNPI